MAQTFELEGTLKHIYDVQTFASGFSKREFVVEVPDGKYPQMIKFECVKDKTSMLDGVSVGDAVKVAFDIRGSEYKERFYVNLNAWKLSKADGGGGGRDESDQRHNSSLDSQFDNEPDASDDIPF
jgi:single-strand DNA-binding protein